MFQDNLHGPHNLTPPYSHTSSSCTAPFKFSLKTLTFFLSVNIQGYSYLRVFTLLFLCLASAWLFPFHHSGFKFSERPTLITLMLLFSSHRHTCSNLFYFYPNTYNSLKFSYLYRCLWPVFPSTMFRAVSLATRLVPSTQERHHKNLLNE